MQPQGFGPQQYEPYQGGQYAPGLPKGPGAHLQVGVDRFMAGVMAWMGAGLGVTAATAWGLSLFPDLVMQIFTSPLRWLVLLAPIGFVWFISARAHRMPPGRALGMFLLYAGLNGVAFATIPLFFSGLAIFSVFLVTGIMFGVTALFGYVTKKDLSGFGKFLFMALIGLMVAIIVSFFVPGMSLWINILGVLLFAGLTAYDTQRLRQVYLTQGGTGNLAVVGALMLYLDFINMFLFLLHLFGGNRD